MQEFLPFIIAGIAAGSIYGLAATGLVLTYKTSGIFNFGQGALATAAAYIFYAMHYANNINWVVSLVVSVVIAGPLMGLGMERISRRLSQQSVAWKIVATTGLILIVQGLGTIKYGSDTIDVPQFLPKGADSFQVGGVNISYAQLIVTVVGVVAVAGLYALFRWTRTGTAMRAVVDDPDLLAMQATSPVRVRRAAWIIGTTFAALSGVLVLPFIGLNAIALTYIVVQAFGAAALGAFSSIPLTFIGAIAIEIVANISQKYVVNVSWLSGLPDSLPFIVLFVALFLLSRRRLTSRSGVESRPPLQWQGPVRVRVVTGVVVVGLLAVVPWVVGAEKIGFWTIGLTQMIMLLSLGLLVKTSGQVSLCQATFGAIGAVAFSQLTVGAGIPWFAALLLAGLIVVPVGAFLAIPAIRLPGLFLALATFGFGIFVQQMLYSTSWMFTVLQSGRAIPRPSIGSTDTGYYYVVLVILVVTALIMVAIHEARLGRLLRGLSDSPLAVATMGLSTNTTRVIVFCISAFFAAISGVLYAASIHFAVSSDIHFDPFYSLTLLAVLALAPFAEPWYAIFGLIAAVIPGYLTSTNVTWWLNVIFGVSAVAVALRGSSRGDASPPQGVPRTLRAPAGGRGCRCRRRAPAAHAGRRRPASQGSPCRVRRSCRRRRAQLLCAARAHHRADRPERSRQDDHVRRLQRPQPQDRRPDLAARQGADEGGGVGARAPGTGPDFPAHGLVRPPYGGGERGARPRVSARWGQRPGSVAGDPLAAKRHAGRHPVGDGPVRNNRAGRNPGRSAVHRSAAAGRAGPVPGWPVRCPDPRRALVGS